MNSGRGAKTQGRPPRVQPSPSTRRLPLGASHGFGSYFAASISSVWDRNAVTRTSLGCWVGRQASPRTVRGAPSGATSTGRGSPWGGSGRWSRSRLLVVRVVRVGVVPDGRGDRDLAEQVDDRLGCLEVAGEPLALVATLDFRAVTLDEHAGDDL